MFTKLYFSVGRGSGLAAARSTRRDVGRNNSNLNTNSNRLGSMDYKRNSGGGGNATFMTGLDNYGTDEEMNIEEQR